MQKNPTYSIQVSELTIGYTKPKLDILHKDLNFTIQAGNLVSIIGGNGVGKTTLLRTISKLQQPINGQVFIQNKPLSRINNLEMAKEISLVLTDPPASKSISVREFITLGRHPHTNWIGRLTEMDKQKITKAIEVTNVKDLLDYKCFQLSDGQYQSIAIARAIAQDTPIIILDEPTTHLDLYNRASVLKLLQNLTKEYQKTILFSTHEIELALQLSDYILVLHPEYTLLDKPKKIIDSGVLSKLFPEDTIHFDSVTQRFKIR